MEDNLILKAYRNDENPNTIEIDLKAHTYGYELYRISLTLIDKIIKLSHNGNATKEDKEKFLSQLKDDYFNFFQTENNK